MKKQNIYLMTIFLPVFLMMSPVTHAAEKTPVEVLESDFGNIAIVNQFQSDMVSATKITLADDSYHRIPLDSPEVQQWFLDITKLYWHGNIELDDYVFLGKNKFPAYEDSFIKFAKNLNRMTAK
ncbi:hypothetical protein [Aeromonas taiwanensis]|uniref:hypothetical protein n=1 Tax=Aeromonas taiwanensis TaxID=633417 RepID=UPI00207C5B76|nr:hypothetical protein [Aeromonas taiwanensis]MCO4203295.1 hypothetical protein [Aeromonas taiwanensis]